MGQDDGSTYGESELVVMHGADREAGFDVVVAVRVEDAVPNEIEEREVELIGAAAGADVDGSTAGAAVFGRQTVGNDGNFSDAVLDGLIAHLQVTDVVFRDDDGGSVNGDIVIIVAAAADPGCRSTVSGVDSGNEGSKRVWVATLRRQVENRF